MEKLLVCAYYQLLDSWELRGGEEVGYGLQVLAELVDQEVLGGDEEFELLLLRLGR